MQATEQQIKMTAQLYEMRDAARQILGDKYKPRMAEIGEVLSVRAAAANKSIFAMVTELCNDRALIGMDALMIVAAAVEIVEPSSNMKGEK